MRLKKGQGVFMILDRIVASARRRADAAKAVRPLEIIRGRALALPKAGEFPFERALSEPGASFICEIKKASPSRGIISEDFPYLDIAREYEAAGAGAISVLTEPDFFQGSAGHLSEIASEAGIPVLRKDFIIDEYQIYESKLLGASAILLICAILGKQELKQYIRLADDLGLSALAETRTEEEAEAALAAGARIIGVNNRDLRTFEVDLRAAGRIRPLVPDSALFVAESGIMSAEDMRPLLGMADAFLIGEAMMRAPDKTAFLRSLKCVK
jgi:indole-3-glycerol phosphate synthase